MADDIDLARDGDKQPPEDHALGGDIHEDATIAELSGLVSDDDLLGASDEAGLSVSNADNLDGRPPSDFETPDTTQEEGESGGWVTVASVDERPDAVLCDAIENGFGSEQTILLGDGREIDVPSDSTVNFEPGVIDPATGLLTQVDAHVLIIRNHSHSI